MDKVKVKVNIVTTLHRGNQKHDTAMEVLGAPGIVEAQKHYAPPAPTEKRSGLRSNPI